MESAVERTLDVLILLGSTAYTATALCGVSAMWTLRKQFFIALRSPQLGCLIGAIHTTRSALAVYYFLLLHDWSPNKGDDITTIFACFNIVFSPASLVALAATIAWVVRLLVMYDPAKRKKWGRYTNERRTFRALVWTYVLIEFAAWASVYPLGAERTALLVSTLDIVGTLATLTAAILLTGKLRKVHDICRLSSDTQLIGAIMVCRIVVATLAFVIPVPQLLFKYMLVVLAISAQPLTYLINIRPVRDYLRQHDHPDVRAGTLLLLLLKLWARLCQRVTCGDDNGPPAYSSGIVACTTTDTNDLSSATRSELRSSGYEHLQGSQLATVMEFFPLKQAFEDYCHKALCSESFQFLVDVSEFQALVHAAHGVGGESGKDDFDEFIAIVNEYIKDNSNSEINIDSSTKKKILGFCERSAYFSLIADDREKIFLLAQREIAKVLAENLLNKFKATKQYKELVGDTFLEQGK